MKSLRTIFFRKFKLALSQASSEFWAYSRANEIEASGIFLNFFLFSCSRLLTRWRVVSEVHDLSLEHVGRAEVDGNNKLKPWKPQSLSFIMHVVELIVAREQTSNLQYIYLD